MESASQLTQLPGEIVCQIFAATNSIQTILTLTRTCRLFTEVWNINKESICRDVLPASLPSYSEARELAQIELEIQCVSGESVNTRVLNHAREAEYALKLFIENFVKPHGDNGRFFWPRRLQPPFMSKSERLRFVHAYHITKALVLCSSSPKHRQAQAYILQQIPVHPYFHVRDAARWLSSVCDDEYRNRWLDRSPANHSEQLYSGVPPKTRSWWKMAHSKIDALFYEHPAISAKRETYGCACPEWNPEGIFTLFDHCQDEIVERPAKW